MKKIFLAVATALAMFSCSQKEPVTVTITNPLSIDRNGEMVEISMAEITGKLQLPDTAQVIVLDENGLEVPYQITYDDMLIFPASVKGDASAVYTIAEGTPQPVDVVACGRQYPERLDDVAWENDRAAYRAYGPALQEKYPLDSLVGSRPAFDFLLRGGKCFRVIIVWNECSAGSFNFFFPVRCVDIGHMMPQIYQYFCQPQRRICMSGERQIHH